MRMTKEEFDRERRYQMLMYQVKRMLGDGLITETEFLEIDTKYRQKYRPKSGGLLVRKDLLIRQRRGIYGEGKEGSDSENQQN